MGRGGDRWHDGAALRRPPMPLIGNIPRFERPGRFEGRQRFNGPHGFNGARGDGPPRFNGPGSNRFNVPRFDGRPRFDASPMFMRGGVHVQLEGPFRGGPAMGPRFQGPVPGGGVQPLLSQVCPPWYGNDELEDEEEMQSEDFERKGSDAPPLFDHGRPPWSDGTHMENEGNMQGGSSDDSSKAENIADASVSESKNTENTVTSDSSAVGEKRVRKSRWSSVPPDSTEQHSSTPPGDSITDAADSNVNAETVKTDTV